MFECIKCSCIVVAVLECTVLLSLHTERWQERPCSSGQGVPAPNPQDRGDHGASSFLHGGMTSSRLFMFPAVIQMF